MTERGKCEGCGADGVLINSMGKRRWGMDLCIPCIKEMRAMEIEDFTPEEKADYDAFVKEHTRYLHTV